MDELINPAKWPDFLIKSESIQEKIKLTEKAIHIWTQKRLSENNIMNDNEDLENEEATWFIDPPYKYGGEHYVMNGINYDELAEWCKSRKGQVIVCENTSADWLDFEPLIEITGQRKKTTEAFKTFYNFEKN